jgi:hypothetical protein
MSQIESVTYTVSGKWGGGEYPSWNGYPVQVKFTVSFPATSNSTPATEADVDAWDDLARTVANWGLPGGAAGTWEEVDSITREVATTEQIQGLTSTQIPL